MGSVLGGRIMMCVTDGARWTDVACCMLLDGWKRLGECAV